MHCRGDHGRPHPRCPERAVPDTIVDDIARVLGGEAPQAALTPQAMRVRTEALEVLGA
jgi:hypothetical protein